MGFGEDGEQGVMVALVFRRWEVGREDVSCAAMDYEARSNASRRLSVFHYE